MSAKLERGALRLEIARKITKLPEGADVMRHIEAMNPEKREELRGMVDWEEEYERCETKTIAT